MTKHTPGPWTMHPRGKDGAEVRAITSVAWCGIALTHGVSGSQVIRADEAQANARLIAAAPDLLAACELMLTVYGLSQEAPHATDVMRAAVARAKGEKK